MSLNATKIEWCDFSFNPYVGCNNGCHYCYARRQARRKIHCPDCYEFRPHFHTERLSAPYKRKKPTRIFLGSMGELFGDWVPEEWILKVLKVVEDNPQHTFMLLTKCPENMKKWSSEFPDNLWAGVSIDTQARASYLHYLKESEARVKFISFEPLLGPVEVNLEGIDWIIAGGQTKPTKIPPREWVEPLINEARRVGAAVFLKDNLRWPVQVREWPEA